MEKFYSQLFAKTYDTFTGGLERSLYKKRHGLLNSLEGNILDVGSGTGNNFQFYRKGTKITAVEPSASMMRIAKSKVEAGQMITFYEHGVLDASLDQLIQPNSFDAIVCTLVLCTIPDPKMALERFRNLLKPEGKLILLEHIHAHKPVNRRLQKILNPAWKICGDGCNLTRDTDKLVKAAGFYPLSEEYFKRTLRFYAGVFSLST